MTSAVVEKAEPLKARQQAMWASGDFAVIGSIDPPDRRRAALRSRRSPRRRVRPGRRRWQRQCHAGGGTPFRGGDVHRHRARAPRARAPKNGRGRLRRHVRHSGRRSIAVRRGSVRRRPVHVRRDVRTRPRTGGARTAARVPARRSDRPRELDTGGLHRRSLSRYRQARAARAWSALAASVGSRTGMCGICFRASSRSRTPPGILVPVQITPALH